MNPVIVQFGPLAIRWYGVMMAVTILLGLWTAYRIGPRLGIATALIDRTAVVFIVLAFVGARAGYVLSHPAEFTNPVEIIRIDHGGLTSHGAIAGGLLALWIASRRERVPFWTLADTAVWVVPIGNIFVRFGNFMNGELYGDPTSLPWAVTFPTASGPRHPLQIYEMLWAAVVLVLTLPLTRWRAFPGQLFWIVLVLTSVGRIAFDLLRSEDRVWGVVTLGMIPAIILIVLGVWCLLRGKRRLRSS